MNLRRITSIDIDVEQLASIAQAEGHQNINTLISEYRSGVNRFALPGEALFGAYIDGALVAIGGLNIDPYEPTSGSGRVRRVYVNARWRRDGVGTAVMNAIESAAVSRFPVLQLFTASKAAAGFYESRGYARQSRYKVSHSKVLSTFSIC